jgi:hypothetical protein
LRRSLLERGTHRVIANNQRLDKLRNLIERSICRFKDGRRIGTRYDKLAASFPAANIASVRIFGS